MRGKGVGMRTLEFGYGMETARSSLERSYIVARGHVLIIFYVEVEIEGLGLGLVMDGMLDF